MIYTTVRDLSLSRISLGTAPFGSGIPQKNAFDILDRYLDMGGNLLDTAAVYGFGLSEQTIGAWMQERGLRHRVYISTKGCHPSLPDWKKRVNEEALRADLENSLRNLKSDHTDIYFLHRDDEELPVSAIMPMLDRMVREGKIRYLGASNWTAKRIDEANAFSRANGLAEFSVSQIMWNSAQINKSKVPDQTLVVMDETEREGYLQNRIPVMAYTSQARGLFSHIQEKDYDALPASLATVYLNDVTKARAEQILAIAQETGLSPTAVSLARLLRDSVTCLPIIGVSSVARLEESMQALSLPDQYFRT